jgi:hypothetical protein
MKTRSRLQLAALILALVSLVIPTVGCSASNVSIATYISLAVNAGSKILSVLGVLTPQMGDFVTQGETWLAFTTTELATTDTNVVKVLKITQEFNTIAQPDLSLAGPMAQVVGLAFSVALSAVLAAVQASAANQPAVLAAAKHGVKNFQDTTVVMPDAQELKALTALHNKALAVVAKVKKQQVGK